MQRVSDLLRGAARRFPLPLALVLVGLAGFPGCVSTPDRANGPERLGAEGAAALRQDWGGGRHVPEWGRALPGRRWDALQRARDLALGGDPEAAYTLGIFFIAGDEIPPDYRAALDWFRLGAAMGDAQSQSMAAYILAEGLHGEHDLAGAATLFAQSAESGYLNLMNDAAWFFSTVCDPLLRDPERALEWILPVIQSDPATAAYIDTLAACYAALGRMDDAVNMQSIAIFFLHDPEEEEEFFQRLRLYEAGHALFLFGPEEDCAPLGRADGR